MPVLKFKKHNQKKEEEFERKYQRSLSLTERFRMVVRQSKLVLQMMVKNGYRKPSEIIKRI